MTKTGRCKDCPPDARTRPVSRPGPRCATHQRIRRATVREASWARWIWATYHLTPARYYAILAIQGGRCYICRRATGARKKLSVDHDHSCCPEKTSCGRCVRGLLCNPCNRDVLGHLREEIEAFERCIEYLTRPPAGQVPEEET